MTEVDKKEILFLIARFLNNSSCKKSAKILAEELSEQKLLPTRTDWQGRNHFSGFEEVGCNYVDSNLDDVLSRAIVLAQREGVFHFPNMHSLLGNCYMRDGGARSLLSTSEACTKFSAIGNERQGNLHFMLSQREVQTDSGSSRIFKYSSVKLLRSALGHLAPLYCLSYDVTGRYIVSGADDGLVKIWCCHNGRLLATLRGHHAEVSDIAISQDNTLIASASNDKNIRIWCAQTGAPLAILTGHSGIVSSVQFIPSAQSDCQYLASTGMDGFAMFWKFNASTREFSSNPVKFMEKNRIGDQTLCSAYSPGGSFFVTGCSDHIIRVYDTAIDPPQLQVELTGHTDLIMVMQCGSTGKTCFATGARDGTGRLWWYKKGEWCSTILPACQLGEASLNGDNQSTKWKRQVTMVAFDCTDTFVFTASSPDCIVRSWHIDRGTLYREYKQHTNEVFVIETHPRDPRVFVSAGHDGIIVIWDMFNGDKLNQFKLKYDEGTACLYDARFSPDGTRFTTVDSQGCLSFFGFGKDYHYKKYPVEQFFHTDYRPLLRDRQHNVLDEQAQVPPHLMPPPVLVDIDGNTHTLAKQIGILELICRPGTLSTFNGIAPSIQSRTVPPGNQSHAEAGSSSTVGRSRRVQPRAEEWIPENERDDPTTPASSESVAEDNSTSAGVDGAAAEASPNMAEDGPPLGELPILPIGILWTNHFTEKAYEDAVWLWQNRAMIPTLDSDTLKRSASLLDTLFRREVDEFAAQRAAIPLAVEEEVTSPMSNTQSSNRMLRSGRVLLSDDEPELEDGLGRSVNEDQASVWSMVLSDEDAESLLYREYNNSSTDSSVMSDWVAENPDLSTATVRKSSRKRSSRRVEKDQVTDEGGADIAAGESSAPQNYDQYQPSPWLTEVEPKSCPYYPQVGDAVMYFRQGHEQYLQAVRRELAFSTRGMALPWQLLDLRAHELCQVTQVQFIVGPPTLCEITLGLITPQHTEQAHPMSITFRYHDMDDVLDFMIPAETFRRAVSVDFVPGVHFKSFIEDSWWSGTVVQREPLSQQFPNSYWLCYRVEWDDGVIESISPWDMTVEASGSSSVSPSASVMETNPWDGESKEAAKERICKGIEQLCAEMKEAELFADAVSLADYPDYCTVVPLPMDLSLIKKRLQNGFYRRKLSLLWDVLLIYHNAIAYNEDGSDIVEDAKKVVYSLYSFIRDPESSNVLDYCDDAVMIIPALPEKEVDVLYNAFSLEQQEPPVGGQHSNERPRVATLRKGQKRKPSKCTSSQASEHNSSWSEYAKELLEDLVCKDFAEVFLHPVDIIEYQDYPYLVQKPMSLSEVTHKLDVMEYDSAKDFTEDLVLIVKNSEVYNTDIHSLVYHLTLQLKEWLAEKLVQFWGDLSALDYPTRSKVRKVAALGHSYYGADAGLTNNVDATSNDSSLADTSSVKQEPCSPEEHQPVSYRLRRRRRVSEDRCTDTASSLPGSSEEQTQRTVLTRHGRKVKPTQRFTSFVQ